MNKPLLPKGHSLFTTFSKYCKELIIVWQSLKMKDTYLIYIFFKKTTVLDIIANMVCHDILIFY